MVSTYLRLTDYNDRALTTSGKYEGSQPIANSIHVNSSQLLKISSFSSDVEQQLNIGSQSTGAGAGKVTFNPMAITKQADAVSPILFQMAAAGTPFKTIEVLLVDSSGVIVLKYLYKLVAVKTVSWSANSDSQSAAETVTFEYGGLVLFSTLQGPDGKITPAIQAGWNRVRNVVDNDATIIIK